MSITAINLENISFTYPDGTGALKETSLRVTHGESVAIIGANGAGKSTLLQLISGIITTQQGQVEIEDLIINKKNISKIRKKIGFIFQNPDDQLFMMSVYEDIAFGLRNFGYTEKEVEDRVTSALNRVGVYSLKDRAPYKLSGGEKRAASIAVILAMKPDIFLMDEPTTALDPISRLRFIKLTKSFTQTKIIATHDLDMALDLCERVILLNKGKIVADGKTKDILSDSPLLNKYGLDLPLSVKNCPVCGNLATDT